MSSLAHIRPPALEGHLLIDHSQDVAELAKAFADDFESGPWAQLAGRWHDLGKYQAAFQRYIRSKNGLDAHIETAPHKVKHAIAGAIHAAESLGLSGQLLAYLIAGHHAGLPDWHPGEAPGAPLSQELQEAKATLEQAKAGGAPAQVLDVGDRLPRPPISDPGELHMWLRLLFSCLVDADFLDTERFMDQGKSDLRIQYPAITTLRDTYDQYMAAHFSQAQGRVNLLRAEIRAACLARSDAAQGLFSLTVPTGGGKTLASLGFALHHAVKHGLRRIIYVIPYTSIIEQTADVFRRLFADLAPSPVIEHHSNLEIENETPQSRLAAENWDAPIIVTTNVQFFESLYAAKGSRCRKLHNLVRSLVILDEAQLLPPEHLSPVLDGLRQLLRRYRVSLVLSTATQPELAKTRRDPFGRALLQGLGAARELAPDPVRLYADLARVSLSLPKSEQDRRDWPSIARELADLDQVLCIVNRRDDAETLWRLLPPGAIHLSARMCGAHRAQVIGTIRARLRNQESLRVVSTQLVEAGVDLDFPVVYRAMAGLDSIAQAAGRCNREGQLPHKGRVYVFNPPKPSPSGLLRKAEDAAHQVIYGSSGEPLEPANFSRYFDLFYGSVNNHDQEDILNLLVRDAAKGQFQFRTAASKFHLIPDEGQRPVFVFWGEGWDLIQQLKREGPRRDLLRRLQRHAVTLYDYQWKKLLASGDLELHQDFLIQASEVLYHPDLGLLPEVPDYQPTGLVA